MMQTINHHDVRTTLTIDDDVAALLEKEMRRTGQPLKQTVNQLLRSGLQQAAAPVKPKPFKVRARKIGLPSEWTSGSISELIEMLEGPLHR
ncbi:MAG TPA: hypothetical protein VF214_11290 [Edaphobacter sp.]